MAAEQLCENGPLAKELHLVNEQELIDYNVMLKRWLDASGCDGSCHRPTLQAAVKELRLGASEYWDRFRAAIEMALQSTQSPPSSKMLSNRSFKAQVLDVIDSRVLDQEERLVIRQYYDQSWKAIHEKKVYIRRIKVHVDILLGGKVDMFGFRSGQRLVDLEEKWRVLLENIDYQLAKYLEELVERKVADMATSSISVKPQSKLKRELVANEFTDSENPYQLTLTDRHEFNRILTQWAEANGADGTCSRPLLRPYNTRSTTISRQTWDKFVSIVKQSVASMDTVPKFETFRKFLTQAEVESLLEERIIKETDRHTLLTFTALKWEILSEPAAQMRRIRLLTALIVGNAYQYIVFKSTQPLLALAPPWRRLLDHLEIGLTRILLRAFDVDQSDVQVVRADKVPASSSRIADCVATDDVLENEVDGEMDLVRSMERLTLHDDAAVQEQVTGYSTNQFFIFWTPQTNNNNPKTFISQKNCSSQITNDPKTFISQKQTGLYTAMASHGATAIQKRNPMSASESFDDLKKRLIHRLLGDKHGVLVDDEDDDTMRESNQMGGQASKEKDEKRSEDNTEKNKELNEVKVEPEIDASQPLSSSPNSSTAKETDPLAVGQKTIKKKKSTTTAAANQGDTIPLDPAIGKTNEGRDSNDKGPGKQALDPFEVGLRVKKSATTSKAIKAKSDVTVPRDVAEKTDRKAASKSPITPEKQKTDEASKERRVTKKKISKAQGTSASAAVQIEGGLNMTQQGGKYQNQSFSGGHASQSE